MRHSAGILSCLSPWLCRTFEALQNAGRRTCHHARAGLRCNPCWGRLICLLRYPTTLHLPPCPCLKGDLVSFQKAIEGRRSHSRRYDDPRQQRGDGIIIYAAST